VKRSNVPFRIFEFSFFTTKEKQPNKSSKRGSSFLVTLCDSHAMGIKKKKQQRLMIGIHSCMDILGWMSSSIYGPTKCEGPPILFHSKLYMYGLFFASNICLPVPLPFSFSFYFFPSSFHLQLHQNGMCLISLMKH
jgi:hypothetical protein